MHPPRVGCAKPLAILLVLGVALVEFGALRDRHRLKLAAEFDHSRLDCSDQLLARLEYYSAYSPIGAIPAPDQQQHILFVVTDFKVLGLDVNFGMGFGLTNGSDGLVTKIIIGKAF